MGRFGEEGTAGAKTSDSEMGIGRLTGAHCTGSLGGTHLALFSVAEIASALGA